MSVGCAVALVSVTFLVVGAAGLAVLWRASCLDLELFEIAITEDDIP